jgi:hypothetical protein
MSAPVTNQSYIQQNNQLFDWAKTATPQQIEAAKQGLPKDSPLLLAIGMGVQYQQQARAPHPQAPQKTVMEQKLGEFAQTSAQGLPSVGGNQMAMQQVDPMRGAGIGVAPENTPAPQQAATGGLVALAQGGEVKRFANGGSPEADDGDDGELPTSWLNSFMDNQLSSGSGIPAAIPQETDPIIDEDFGSATSPKVEPRLSDFVTHKVKKHPVNKNSVVHAPAATSSAARNEASPTAKGETYQGLKDYLSKGEVDPNAYGADAAIASMLNKNTTPKLTQEESIENIQKLLGPEVDLSEEVNAAKEATANARRDKGLMALTQGIGGMLSAQTPYMSQALGAGLLSGVSGYQSGAKDEAAAEKEQRALRTAQKTSELQGHKTAASMYLAQQAKVAEAEAEARAKREETMLGIQGNLGLERVKGANSMQELKARMYNEQAIQIMKDMSEMERKQFDAGVLSADKIAEVVGRSMQGGSDPKETQDAVNNLLAIMRQNKMGGGSSSQPFNSLGNGFGISKGQ